MEALIELRNVGKWYAAGRPVVQQVDLAVYRGQGLAIRGRNGSGKTTLLKLIAGITRPSAGAGRRADPTSQPRVRRRCWPTRSPGGESAAQRPTGGAGRRPVIMVAARCRRQAIL